MDEHIRTTPSISGEGYQIRLVTRTQNVLKFLFNKNNIVEATVTERVSEMRSTHAPCEGKPLIIITEFSGHGLFSFFLPHGKDA